MKRFKRYLALALLAVSLSVPASAGNIENPGIAGNIENPGILWIIVDLASSFL